MKKTAVCFDLLFSLLCHRAAGQAEVSGWGNLRGIRVGGQLVPFTTAVGVYNPDFSQLTLSQREGPTRTSQYVRSNNAVTVGASLQYGGGGARRAAAPSGATNAAAGTNNAGAPGRRGGFGGRGGGGSGFNYTITYTDSAPGTCDVNLRLTSTTDQTIGGIYYFLTLPSDIFPDALIFIIDEGHPSDVMRIFPGRATVRAISFVAGSHRIVDVSFGK